MFYDSTPLLKSKNLSVMFSSILNLPQRIREAKDNLIVHSIVMGYCLNIINLMQVLHIYLKFFPKCAAMNFNEWFEMIQKSFANVFDGSITIYGCQVQLKCTIFDSPARAKALNWIGHGGYFACIHCLARGEHVDKIIYPYQLELPVRNQVAYISNLKNLNSSKKTSLEGIKGPTSLTKVINIFENVLYDYMHLCCEGYVKRFLLFITNSNNHYKNFYIGYF
jgi:hypothetical protein